ncbi:hypothetical protein [Paludisphaera sp.]|uniref:hypothetical protein n=1 Tax=Paludisphaera sp. TaxID=2017432 RepID=UPI00301C772E
MATRDPDMERLIINSTVDLGASACGQNKRGKLRRRPAVPRGGFSTKIHLGVDALGNPVRVVLTGGQVADVTQAEPMVRAVKAEA